MQMDDIKGVSTIHKGVVAAYDYDVGFGSDYGEESKSFDQRQQQMTWLSTDAVPGQFSTSYYHSLDADG
jgi:hypothetical protein